MGGKMTDKAINPYWWGPKFLRYCVKQSWLRQEGSGGRGTKWYPTGKGKEELKDRISIENTLLRFGVDWRVRVADRYPPKSFQHTSWLTSPSVITVTPQTNPLKPLTVHAQLSLPFK